MFPWKTPTRPEEREGQKHTPALPPAGPYGHGQGGLFARTGQDTRIFSAMVMPLGGLFDALPLVDRPIDGGFSGYQNEYFSTLTGVTQGAALSIANQPTEPCQDGPEGGLTKVCTLVSPYGDYTFKTKTLDLKAIGLLRDPADLATLYLANPPMLEGKGSPGLAQGARDMLNNELSRRVWETGLSSKLMLSRRIWVGNPANSAASNNWKDILGLDLQINQNNKVDMLTMSLCKAMNSDIKNFGHRILSAVPASLYNHIDTMYGYLTFNTRRTGLGANWDGWIVMRPELWDELTKVWPVAEYTEALTLMQTYGANTGGNINLTGESLLQARQMMRESQVLPIRGQLVPVILDDSITENTPNQIAALLPGQYSSDIYFVPRTVLGGIPVTYIQPLRYSVAIYNAVLAASRANVNHFTSDGGQFLWAVNAENFCVDMNFTLRFRLICHTPHIAGRLLNVGYQPLQHYRTAFPDVDYFDNGGSTNTPIVTFYSEWSTTEPTH